MGVKRVLSKTKEKKNQHSFLCPKGDMSKGAGSKGTCPKGTYPKGDRVK
jgi:hypothetical protein